MPNPESLKGKGFDTNPQNINKKGRPKNIYNILRQSGYSSDDIKTVFQEFAWMTISQLNEIYKDPNQPTIMRTAANQYYLAFSKGNWDKIEKLMLHVLGPPRPKDPDQDNEAETFERIEKSFDRFLKNIDRKEAQAKKKPATKQKPKTPTAKKKK